MQKKIVSLLDERAIGQAMDASISGMQGYHFNGMATDSRRVSGGDLFFALKGENFDAHRFIPDVVARGVKGIVVSNEVDVPEDVCVFRVADVRLAFGALARAILEKRRAMGGFTTYALTGSNGKTTTKELLAALLTAKGFHPLKTLANYNNDIGLPMTVSELTAAHDCAVLEMGANAPGEIRYLSGLARPDYALITCIAHAHIAGFGSWEGVARAKGEMLENDSLKTIVLPSETRAFYEKNLHGEPVVWVGGDEKIRAEHVVSSVEGIRFDYVDEIHSRRYAVQLPLLGAHNAENLTKALALLDRDWNEDELNRALADVQLPSGRLEPWHDPNGVCFLHDAYNANPSSMNEALNVMAQIAPEAHRVLILGDMRELGPQSADYHFELGQHAARLCAKRILAVGAYANDIVRGALSLRYPENAIHAVEKDDLDEGLSWLSSALSAEDICLIKGSHGVALERVLNVFHAVRSIGSRLK